MRRLLFIPVLLALAIGIAVVVMRRGSEAPPEKITVAAPEPEPAPDPAPAPDVSPPVEPSEEKAPAMPSVRSAFDRLLEALRSGDRERIREALAEVEKVLVPEPVPDEENAALVYQKAFKKLTEWTEEESDAYMALGNGELTADQQAAIRKLLEKNRDAIALLRKAAEFSKCRFPVDYTAGVSAELPHITSMITATKLLNMASLFGKEPVSRASWRLSESLASEPILVSQLVRSVCHGIAREGIQAEWKQLSTAESLERWIGEIRPERIRSGLERSMLFELYSGTKVIVEDKVPDTFFALTGVKKPEGPLAAQALAEYADTLTQYASLAGRPYYEVREDLAALERVKTEGAPWYDVYSRQLLPAMSRSAARQAETEASFGATRIAAAVELYRQQKGSYPATLGDLGSVLPDPPRDPFTGREFVYRRDGSGFTVYSLGEDGADGGGSTEHDVVFQSPR